MTPARSSESGDGRKVHRFNVNFSEGAYRDLTNLAESTGRTMAQVLRDGIALVRFFDDEQRKGNHILVEKDGRVREVLFRMTSTGPQRRRSRSGT